jgi:hypothetical protein
MLSVIMLSVIMPKRHFDENAEYHFLIVMLRIVMLSVSTSIIMPSVDRPSAVLLGAIAVNVVAPFPILDCRHCDGDDATPLRRRSDSNFFSFLVVPNPGKDVYHYRVLLLTVPHN